MSKISNWVINNPQNIDDNTYWIDRCYELEQKYSKLLKTLADSLAEILTEELTKGETK